MDKKASGAAPRKARARQNRADQGMPLGQSGEGIATYGIRSDCETETVSKTALRPQGPTQHRTPPRGLN
jgi:hypothetical protein